MSDNVIQIASFVKKAQTPQDDLDDEIDWFANSITEDAIDLLEETFGIYISDFPEATASMVLLYEALFGVACLVNNKTYPTQEIAHDLFDEYINEAHKETPQEPVDITE